MEVCDNGETKVDVWSAYCTIKYRSCSVIQKWPQRRGIAHTHINTHYVASVLMTPVKRCE